jgi:hypothetical protein
MLEQFGRQAESETALAQLATSLGGLRTQMQSGFAPNEKEVDASAAAARSNLSQFLAQPSVMESFKLTAGQQRVQAPQIVNPQTILSILSTHGQTGAGKEDALASWDVATQVYLTLVALSISRGDQPISVTTLLHQIRGDLEVPANYESDSSQSQQVRMRLNQILRQLDQRLDR